MAAVPEFLVQISSNKGKLIFCMKTGNKYTYQHKMCVKYLLKTKLTNTSAVENCEIVPKKFSVNKICA